MDSLVDPPQFSYVAQRASDAAETAIRNGWKFKQYIDCMAEAWLVEFEGKHADAVDRVRSLRAFLNQVENRG